MSLLSFAPVEPQDLEAINDAGARFLGELEPFHLKRGWRTISQIQRLRRLFRDEHIDIVHSHFLTSNAWYAALSRFHPTVITVMGGDILGDNWEPGSDVRERWLTPFALRNADLITCWSSKLTNVVKRYSRPEIPVAVIHGGVDTNHFCPGPKPDDLRAQLHIPAGAKIVLSPRLMRPLYNLDKVALAASELWQKMPNTYFLFAVLPQAKDLAYEQRVREILSKDGANRVRFLDTIPHDRMVDYYRLADVTISIPSSDGTPMSVLESLASGTPVVISDIPNYDPDYIEAEHTVVAVKPDDVDSILNAVMRLLSDETLATDLVTEGRRRIVDYGSYEAQMLRMEGLYYNLTAQVNQ